MMETNKCYNENCLDTMARMPNGYIDLTVTSPPYDNLRTYHGYTFDFENIAKELYRVTKDGGVVVWIVNDATIKGSETGTSFRQALYFKEIGFNLHDTMIYHKTNTPLTHQRYVQEFDYMFIFSKGKIKTFNGIKDKKNIYAGSVVGGAKRVIGSGMLRQSSGHKSGKRIAEYGLRGNVWYIPNRGNRLGHPAVFPEALANDHIISWSNEGDLVYDPFMGSGTTAKMAILNKREWVGSEVSSAYCDIIKARLEAIN